MSVPSCRRSTDSNRGGAVADTTNPIWPNSLGSGTNETWKFRTLCITRKHTTFVVLLGNRVLLDLGPARQFPDDR